MVPLPGLFFRFFVSPLLLLSKRVMRGYIFACALGAVSATFLTEVRDDYGYIEEAYDEYSDNFVDDVYSEDPFFAFTNAGDGNAMWRFPYNFTNDLHKYVVIEDSKDGLPDYTFFDEEKKYTPATLACPKELVKHVYKSRPNDKCTIKGNMFCDVEHTKGHPVHDNSSYYTPYWRGDKVKDKAGPQPRTRRNILQRAIGWVALHAPYHGQCGTSNYRGSTPETCAEDDPVECPQWGHTPSCQGIVAMAWGTYGASFNGKKDISHPIDCANLLPGDQLILNGPTGHILHQFLFRKWINKPLEKFKFYQIGGMHGAGSTDIAGPDLHPWCSKAENVTRLCYHCSRYDHVVEEDAKPSYAKEMQAPTANNMWRWPFNFTNNLNGIVVHHAARDGLPDYTLRDDLKNYTNGTIGCTPELIKKVVTSNPAR